MLKRKLLIASLSIAALNSTIANSADPNSQLYQAQDWIADGVFTQGVEGPAVAPDGSLFAVNFQREGTIGRVTGKGKVEEYLALENSSIGNGIRFSGNGDMYIADYINHNVLVVKSGKKVARVFAHNDEMNQPNDIAIMDNGILFASDPNWNDSTGQLWKITHKGKTQLLETNMGTTNGIEVSPDNKTLYVNESIQRKVWKYQLSEQGEISNKSLLIEFPEHGLDGMRTDKLGNLYIARYGKGVVAIVSPQGELIREVKLKGQFPTNVAFGGDDGKTVFVTMQKRGAIEMFKNEISGRSFIDK